MPPTTFRDKNGAQDNNVNNIVHDWACCPTLKIKIRTEFLSHHSPGHHSPGHLRQKMKKKQFWTPKTGNKWAIWPGDRFSPKPQNLQQKRQFSKGMEIEKGEIRPLGRGVQNGPPKSTVFRGGWRFSEGRGERAITFRDLPWEIPNLINNIVHDWACCPTLKI